MPDRQLAVFPHQLFQPVARQRENPFTLLGAGDGGVAHDAGVFGGVATALGEFGEGQFAAKRLGAGLV